MAYNGQANDRRAVVTAVGGYRRGVVAPGIISGDVMDDFTVLPRKMRHGKRQGFMN